MQKKHKSPHSFMIRYKYCALGLLFSWLTWPAWGQMHAAHDEPIQVLIPETHLNQDEVHLGERLFKDLRLSKDNTVSCEHCHKLSLGGMDGMQTSVGVEGRVGSINAPTVYNLPGQIAYFWDGRAKDLETLISGPLRNPVEMAATWPEVLAKLRKDAELLAEFERIYPQGLDKHTVSRALTQFMRSLVTLDSPMDRWLQGDWQALSEEQIRGYELFKSYGCIACHQGKNVGGNMYATMGVMGDYFKDRGTPIQAADLGRFNVTKKTGDRHVFKVPSLRLVSLTAPYFHDGSIQTLEEAIKIMGYYQLGRDIEARDVAAIAAFLNSLVGRHPLLSVQP